MPHPVKLFPLSPETRVSVLKQIDQSITKSCTTEEERTHLLGVMEEKKSKKGKKKNAAGQEEEDALSSMSRGTGTSITANIRGHRLDGSSTAAPGTTLAGSTIFGDSTPDDDSFWVDEAEEDDEWDDSDKGSDEEDSLGPEYSNTQKGKICGQLSSTAQVTAIQTQQQNRRTMSKARAKENEAGEGSNSSTTEAEENEEMALLLWNDEHHTFDQVIGACERAVHSSPAEAKEIAAEVDRVGRCVILHTSNPSVIFNSLRPLNRVQLTTTVHPAALVLREELAALCISWLLRTIHQTAKGPWGDQVRNAVCEALLIEGRRRVSETGGVVETVQEWPGEAGWEGLDRVSASSTLEPDRISVSPDYVLHPVLEPDGILNANIEELLPANRPAPIVADPDTPAWAMDGVLEIDEDDDDDYDEMDEDDDENEEEDDEDDDENMEPADVAEIAIVAPDVNAQQTQDGFEEALRLVIEEAIVGRTQGGDTPDVGGQANPGEGGVVNTPAIPAPQALVTQLTEQIRGMLAARAQTAAQPATTTGVGAPLVQPDAGPIPTGAQPGDTQSQNVASVTPTLALAGTNRTAWAGLSAAPVVNLPPPVPGGPSVRPRLDSFLRVDRNLWKSLRDMMRDLFIRTLMVDSWSKKDFGSRFAANYLPIAHSHTFLDREPDHSIFLFCVQLFTVPSVADHLVSSTRALFTMLNVFKTFYLSDALGQEVSLNRNRVEASFRLSLTHRSPHYPALPANSMIFKSKRTAHLFSDIGYLLSAPPVRKRIFRDRVKDFIPWVLDTLGVWQRMNPQARKLGAHVDYEDLAWIHAFGVAIHTGRLVWIIAAALAPTGEYDGADAAAESPADSLQRDFQSWREAVRATVAWLDSWCAAQAQLEPDSGAWDVVSPLYAVGGSFKIPAFIVGGSPAGHSPYFLSYHHPVHWLLAELLSASVHFARDAVTFGAESLPVSAGSWSSLLGLASDTNTEPSDDRLHRIFDYSMRVLSFSGQVRAGMWVRNGGSMKDQDSNYRRRELRELGRDQDVFLLQAFAACLPATRFLGSLIRRFDLEQWFSGSFGSSTLGMDPEQESTMAEELLELLILILTERTRIAGLSWEQQTRRELVHQLALYWKNGGGVHSDIVRNISSKNDVVVYSTTSSRDDVMRNFEKHFDKILSEVANFKQPEGTREVGLYELKETCWDEVDPWFAQYSRNQRQDVEEALKARSAKLAARGVAWEPTIPRPTMIPPGTLFANIGSIVQSPLFVQIIYYSLYNATTRQSTGSGGSSHARPKVPSAEFILSAAAHLLLVALAEEQFAGANDHRFVDLACSVSFDDLMDRKGMNQTLLDILMDLADRGDESQRAPSDGPLMNEVRDILPFINRALRFFEHLGTERIRAKLANWRSQKGQKSESESETSGSIASDRDKKKAASKARQAAIMAQLKQQQNNFIQKHAHDLARVGDPSEEDENRDDMQTDGIEHEQTDEQTKVWEFPKGDCIVCQEPANDEGDLYGMLGLAQISAIVRSANLSDWDTLAAVVTNPDSLDVPDPAQCQRNLGNMLVPILWTSKIEKIGVADHVVSDELTESAKAVSVLSAWVSNIVRNQDKVNTTSDAAPTSSQAAEISPLVSPFLSATGSLNALDDSDERSPTVLVGRRSSIVASFRQALGNMMPAMWRRNSIHSEAGGPQAHDNYERVRKIYDSRVVGVLKSLKRDAVPTSTQNESFLELQLLWEAFSYTIQGTEVAARKGDSGPVEASPPFVFLESLPNLAFLRVLSQTVFTHSSMALQVPEAESETRRSSQEFLNQLFHGFDRRSSKVHENLLQNPQSTDPQAIGASPEVEQIPGTFFEGDAHSKSLSAIKSIPLLLGNSFCHLTRMVMTVAPTLAPSDMGNVWNWLRIFYLFEIVRIFLFVADSLKRGEATFRNNSDLQMLIRSSGFVGGASKDGESNESVLRAMTEFPVIVQFMNWILEKLGASSSEVTDVMGKLDPEILNRMIPTLLLPYMRSAALLLHSRFDMTPPSGSTQGKSEYERLRGYLKLSVLSDIITPSVYVTDPFLSPLITGWISELNEFSSQKARNLPSGIVASVLVSPYFACQVREPAFRVPVLDPLALQLTPLPSRLDELVQESMSRRCLSCKTSPANPALCLLCGMMKGACLLLNGTKGSYYPLPYLDSHGESDFGLK
ncbi:hypothetical protein HDU93_000094 [Gonapodya sp. JEL0774]|nr:hypothetical protein HDU93_000094 [Gonapodya sp. JEL0774]